MAFLNGMFVERLLRCVSSAIICFAAASVSFPQTIEDGWKGILPFKTDKATVEKILGKPLINSDGYYNYSSDEAFVQVDFSAEPCTQVPYGRGRYNVPKDRVIRYWVSLRKQTLLSDLKFDRSKY